jgi:hypothetical protein
VPIWLPVPAKSVVSPCASVPAGSPASRPAYRISGWMVALDALNPRARFPWLSIAALPIQRQVVSG